MFNDLACATNRILKENPSFKVLILDLDVHQGDGTAALFSDEKKRKNVMTVSMHAKNNFPFRKAKSDIDVELEDLVEDEFFLNTLKETLADIEERFLPDIILYQAGVDPLKTDRLGRLSLSLNGLRERERLVYEFCLKNNCSIVTTMGGGYYHDDETRDIVCTAHSNQVESLYKLFS